MNLVQEDASSSDHPLGDMMMYDVDKMRQELRKSVTIVCVKPSSEQLLAEDLKLRPYCRGIHPVLNNTYVRMVKTRF